jgi:hypothetical protein
MHTEYAVIDWGQGCQTLLDAFDTYQEAWACARDFNAWAGTQAGDHFATVESMQVEG